MKIRYYLYVTVIVLLLSGCGEKASNGKKFTPKDRTTTKLSIEERDAAIAQKRAELLGGLNLDTLLYSHGVKFCIVQPKLQGEDITQDIADRIVMKMLQMACQNGISGMGTDPGFVMGVDIAQTGRTATGTAPQKMTVNYDLTFKTGTADWTETAPSGVTIGANDVSVTLKNVFHIHELFLAYYYLK